MREFSHKNYPRKISDFYEDLILSRKYLTNQDCFSINHERNLSFKLFRNPAYIVID